MRALGFCFALMSAVALAAASKPAHPSPASSMDKKLAHIRANGKLAHPNQSPTMITEQEVNAYLTSGGVKLPAGVQSVKLTGAPGVINGTAYGEHGSGYVHVDPVSLDGVEVPHFGLEPARDW